MENAATGCEDTSSKYSAPRSVLGFSLIEDAIDERILAEMSGELARLGLPNDVVRAK